MLRRGEMGVGTLVIFIAMVLVASVAAAVFIQTTGFFQGQSLKTGNQVQRQITAGTEVVEISGVDGRDGLIEQMSSIHKLTASSGSMKIGDFFYSESTSDSSSTLTLREDGSTDNDVFTGYYTASSYAFDMRTGVFLDQPPEEFYTVFSQTQTSEMMIGKIAVAIIFPESNGSVDTNFENWTTQEQDEALNYTKDGLNWWNSVEPRANIRHTFEVYRDIPTSYEPISRDTSLGNQSLWINETLDNMGVASGASVFDRLRSFNHALRLRKNAHWAFTLFIIDSSETPGGGFPDGNAGLAYINGPHTLIASSANAPSQSTVFAHEFGHIFGARDQYASSSCTCADTGGYFSIITENCVNGCAINTTSIMRAGSESVTAYNNMLVDTYALGQMGLIDSNDNDLLDPIDLLFESSANGASMSNGTMSTLAGDEYPRQAKGNNRGFFTYEYLQTGRNNIVGNLNSGDLIRVYHESSKQLEEGEEIYINFVPKTGSQTNINFLMPEVISQERIYLYPVR